VNGLQRSARFKSSLGEASIPVMAQQIPTTQRDENRSARSVESASPAGTASPVPEELLYDRHRGEYFELVAEDGAGVTLRRDGTDYYVPRSLFDPWRGSRLFPANEMTEPDLPDWVTP
jgi:hypothetical protein